MTTKELLLSAVRARICGGESIPFGTPPEETLRALYALSKEQDMAHVVAAELAKQGLLVEGNELSGKFQKQQMIAFMRYEQINYELHEVCDTLEHAGIPYLPLKGSVIRAYYEEPWMRTSCDIDILVHKEDLESACRELESSLHYEKKYECTHDVSLYSPGGIHLELHFNLVEEGRAGQSQTLLRDAWQYASPKQEGSLHYVFDDALFYLYHIAHMAKHVEEGGCGIRPFVDLWILEHRIDHDREQRDALLKEAGLLLFADTARHLSEVWFGDASHTELTARLEEFLLSGGVFGSLEQRVAIQQEKKGGRAAYLLNRIFLPYGELKIQYPLLEKHPFLTPVMEVRRWGRLLFRGGAKRSAKVIQLNAKTEKVTNGEGLLEQLGL